MKGVLSATCDLSDFLRQSNFPYCLIGGIANLRWGEQRFTADADVSLFTGFGDETRFIDACAARFAPRTSDAAAFAMESRMLLLQHENGVAFDIALAALPFEERCIARASEFELLPERSVRTCSAEDLIIQKVFAGRAKDWMDVEGVLQRVRTLDWSLIDHELPPLLEVRGTPDALARLHSLRNQTQV